MYHPVKPCAVCSKVYCVRNGFFKPEALKEDANLYFNVCKVLDIQSISILFA